MASQGIVVGCDAYPHVDGGDLAGAVADALAVREWLIDPSGGRLDSSDVQLLASPSARGAVPPDSLAYSPAATDDFAGAIDRVGELPAGPTDRLFVYFAGHGCQTDPHNQSVSEDALVFSDFKPRQPSAGCVGVAGLEQRLRALNYGEFFIFCDACRNFPFEDPFRLGGFGFDVKQRKIRPYHPRGHVFQAALPGGEALGVEINGLMSGRFTRSVLEGLAGAGTAKWFNPTVDPPRYEVTWDRLCRWVQDSLGTPLQAPADGNPVLCSFDDGWFSDIKLNVGVDPARAGNSPGTQIRVEFDNFTDPGAGAISLPGPFPYGQAVPPRRHRIFGRQNGLPWGLKVVDAYTDTDVQLVLPSQPALRPERSAAGRVTRSFESVYRRVRVQITSGDPAAIVEVTDLGGTRVAIDAGVISADITPGSYLARLLLPGQLPAEYPLEILGSAIETQVLTLDPEPVNRPFTEPADLRAAPVARRLAVAGGATLGLTQPVSGPAWDVFPVRPGETLAARDPSVRSRIFATEPGDVLRTDDRAVEVPIIPGIHTSVEFRSHAPLVVRLVDLPLLSGHGGELIVRAQAFWENRMLEACELLLAKLQRAGERSAVAEALESAREQRLRPGGIAACLADSRPAGEVLSGQLWAVRTRSISR
jgi:hypothetical protein